LGKRRIAGRDDLDVGVVADVELARLFEEAPVTASTALTRVERSLISARAPETGGGGLEGKRSAVADAPGTA